MQELYFNFSELFKSEIAQKNGWDNTTSNAKILTNLMNLTWYILNPIRIEIYKKYKVGLNIESAYRCEKLRAYLGASKTGHPDGECADLKCSAMTSVQLFEFIRNMAKQRIIEYDQLILEHNTNDTCLHIGYRKGACRHETMIRSIINGNYVYKKV